MLFCGASTLSGMNVPLVDLSPVNLTNAQIIALFSVSVAVCHCESSYCYFGTESTDLYFNSYEKSIETVQIVEN